MRLDAFFFAGVVYCAYNCPTVAAIGFDGPTP
jgi:hypothetical protein